MQPKSHKVTETPETAPDSALPNGASAIESAVEIGTHFFEQRYLYAFASRAEVAQYIRTQAIPDESKSVETVLSDWENLQPRVHQLVQREAGLADTMHVADVPEEYEPLLRRYAADTLFRRSFVGLPISFGIVEIDNLVAAQRTVNLDYVARLRKKFSEKPTLAELLEICVAPTRAMDPVQHLEIAPNVHVFSSPNSDIRFLGSFLKEITPEDVDASAVGGLPVAAVISFVGYGSPPVNVFKVGGRVVLNNGFHRVFSLRQAGVTHIPVVVQTSNNPTLDFPPMVAGLPKDYLLAVPRPVLMKDFFEPEFATTLRIRDRIKTVTLATNVNQHEVPA